MICEKGYSGIGDNYDWLAGAGGQGDTERVGRTAGQIQPATGKNISFSPINTTLSVSTRLDYTLLGQVYQICICVLRGGGRCGQAVLFCTSSVYLPLAFCLQGPME